MKPLWARKKWWALSFTLRLIQPPAAKSYAKNSLKKNKVKAAKSFKISPTFRFLLFKSLNFFLKKQKLSRLGHFAALHKTRVWSLLNLYCSSGCCYLVWVILAWIWCTLSIILAATFFTPYWYGLCYFAKLCMEQTQANHTYFHQWGNPDLTLSTDL